MGERWYVLTHDKNYHESLKVGIVEAGAEVYSPTRRTCYPRKDRPSSSSYDVLLFPGYLFVRMDMQQISSTTITALNGAYGFVRFGDQEPCHISDEEVGNLKAALEAHKNAISNPAASTIFEKSGDQTFTFIVREKSYASRCAALFTLLKQYDLRNRLSKRKK